MPNADAVHYSSTLKLTLAVSTGDGECGNYGRVTGYKAHITCPVCIRLYEQENCPEAVAQARKARSNGGHSV